MADSSLLASLIAGQDPLAAQMLGGYQGAQLSGAALDPAFGHNEGPFGALAKTIAGFSGGNQLRDAVQAVAAQRAANRPEMAGVLAGDDPYKTIAANPSGYSDQTLAQLLSGATPQSVAEARLAGANAKLAGLNVAGFQGATPAAGAAAGGGVSAPANRKIAPGAGGSALPTADANILGTGRPQAPATPIDTADPIAAAAAMTPQQRQAVVQNPQQRALVLARLRALAAQRVATPMGGAGAARP